MIQKDNNMTDDLKLDIINEEISLWQIKSGLLFGTDALLLAYFVIGNARVHVKTAAELGTGSGVVSLIVAKKAERTVKKIFAAEILEDYCKLALKNIEMNGLSDRITVIHGDIKQPDSFFYPYGSEAPLNEVQHRVEPHSVDIVFTNPPYMVNHGKMSESEHKNIAKHEILCNIGDVLACAHRLLRDKGDFYCVYPAERLQDLFSAMESHNIYPKAAVFVHPRENAKANLALVKGKKAAKSGIIIHPPLILHRADGSLTEFAAEMYQKGELKY